MKTCPRCAHTLDDLQAQCPTCGHVQLASEAPYESAGGLIRGYFRDLYAIIFNPTRFFSQMPTEGGLSGPLTFALVTHWLGAALEYLWHSVIGGAFAPYFEHLFKMAGDVADVDSPGRSAAFMEMKDRVLHWIWGTGSVLADPFFTLASILFTSFFVYLGARIFVTPGKNGAPKQISFESALRIICFGMSPAILAAIPLAGGVISGFLIAIVTIIGAREVYRIGNGRATVVALFPKLLFLGIIFFGVLFFAVAIFKVVATAF